MAQVCGDEFHVNTKDLVRRTLTSKISKRVSRAFSINRTPGKLKRAVSHVFSPFMRDPQGGDLTHSRRLGASTFDLTEESPSGMSHFEDSDCISLGAYSLQEESSPVHFMTPKSTKTPKSKTSKWATIGPQSASKYYK
ncbi:uncharacterized protein [Littorina saxatilis]|uniref:uncharacterized protein n=1 Tax=Littorina saxatilis TaxID=31220 RepID=UPI0038B44389